MKRIVVIILLMVAGVLPAAAQKQVFRAENSYRDYRLDVGLYGSIDNESVSSPVFSLVYTENFWQGAAYKLGLQVAPGLMDYGSLVGVPVAIAWRPGVYPIEYSLLNAAEDSIYDTVWNGLYGRTDEIVSDIAMNFLLSMIRRVEFYAGLTPGLMLGPYSGVDGTSGSRLSLTADAGVVMSLPVWHISLNLTPAYHYAIIPNAYTEDGHAMHHFLTFSIGLGYLF